MISMAQLGGRLPVEGKYFNYPFAETLNYGCVSVFKLKNGKRVLNYFDKDEIKYLSPIKRERENSGRCQLKKNETYVIVCSTEIAGTLGDFQLSIYIDLALRDVEIKRVLLPGQQLGKNE